MFASLGYLYYRSKDDVYSVEGEQLEIPNEQLDNDDLYKDLEDLFI